MKNVSKSKVPKVETILAHVSPFAAGWNLVQLSIRPSCVGLGFSSPVGLAVDSTVRVGGEVGVPGTPTQYQVLAQIPLQSSSIAGFHLKKTLKSKVFTQR